MMNDLPKVQLMTVSSMRIMNSCFIFNQFMVSFKKNKPFESFQKETND